LLVAAGIDASRKDAERATEITLRKIPINDSSDCSEEESAEVKPDSAGIKDEADSRSNSSSGSKSSPDSSIEPRSYAGSGNTGFRNGDSWESDPMRHYRQGDGA
jgi:hypothetical protein